MTLNNPFHGPGLFLCPLGEGSWFSNVFQGVYIERDQCHGMGEKYFYQVCQHHVDIHACFIAEHAFL